MLKGVPEFPGKNKPCTIEIMNMRTHRLSEPYDVRVDRASILGNPYPLDAECERKKVIALYADHLAAEIKKPGPIRDEMIRLYRLHQKYGKLRLFCWCAPRQCHAEHIKKWLETELGK